MKVFIHPFGLDIPMYGLMIFTGLLTANIIAYLYFKKTGRDFDYVILLEAYAGLGGFLGAKGLFLWVSRDSIDWSRFFEADYFKTLIQGGFVFYGGLIGGILFVLIAGKIHKVKAFDYLKSVTFLIPWAHAFGRIGCFCSGCCYGIPYDGCLSVVFPQDSYAISGVPLFPVQLVEAILLFTISIFLFILVLKKKDYFILESYLLLYGIVRFCLENFRYDEARGYFLIFSTSQWISILMMVGAIACIFIRARLLMNRAKKQLKENSSRK